MSPTAIILHGPPCTGKTQISDLIEERYAEHVELINLDSGWSRPAADDKADHERCKRYKVGPERYADVRKAAPKPIVVVELGCGEPSDLSSLGATRGVHEWLQILREQGRSIHAFRLSVNREAFKSRVDEDRPGAPWPEDFYKRYEKKDPLVTFPATAKIDETRIDTSEKTIEEVTNEILESTGLAHH
jgi:hypothetical protein